MKTKSVFQNLFIVLCIMLCTLSNAQVTYQDGLKVLNPDVGNWTKTAGKFESIQVTVTPLGCYTNFDILLEVSAQNTNLAGNPDSLEAEYKFSLPAGAIIHDAKLWMNNIPVKAAIYERSKAKFIYEALVSRRIDPLIIYQNDMNSYEARIFPILNPGSRKVQISYMVPNTITSKGIEVPMDLRMFRSDIAGITPAIQFKVANNTVFGTPVYLGNIQAVITGTYDEFSLNANTNNLYLNNAIYFPPPALGNFFIHQPTTPGEGYYQFMMMPPPTSTISKNVYVLDFRTSNYIDYSTLLQMVKNKIKFTLSGSDSFNVIYLNNGGVHKLSANWIAGDVLSIDNAFATLPQNLNSANSLFLQGTGDAISFINNHGEEGKILIISNAGSPSNNVNFLNQLINTTTGQMSKMYPVSVFDFNNQFTNPVWNGSEYFYNNEYYFYNLAATTGGQFFNLRNDTYNAYINASSSFVDLFAQSFSSLRELHQYDAAIITGNSILHSDYKIRNKVVIPEGEAYMETGRYINSPLNIQIAYYYGIDTQNFICNYSLNPIATADTFIKKMWGYNLIEDQIKNNTGGMYNQAIINNSIQYDVLCEYTALLALEPDTAGTITNEFPTGTTEIISKSGLALQVYPNPFSNSQWLELEFPENFQNKDWTLNVYNSLGQLIRSMNGKTGYAGTLKIHWYQQDSEDLPQGLYWIQFKTGKEAHTIKVFKN